MMISYFDNMDRQLAPEAYSKLTVKEDGTYSFSKMSDATVTNKYLSVPADECRGKRRIMEIMRALSARTYRSCRK